MRIIKFLVMSVVILTLVSGIGLVVIREALVLWGVSQLKSSVSTMRRISANTGSYLQECQKKGIIDPNTPLIGSIQLRFTSPTEYVVEVTCAQFQLQPITVATQKLPPMVTKLPGQSGIVWGEKISGVALTAWGRTRAVIVEDQEITTQSYSATTFLGVGPATSCGGFGFTCCAGESTVGQGDQLTGVTDCPKTCFSRCSSRPVVLSFTSQPFFDPQTRQLDIASQEQVEFAYVVDFGAAQTGRVVIQYGDGESAELTTATGTFTHSYQCATGSCRYAAELVVTDAAQVNAASTPVTHLVVQVKN